MKSRIAYFDFLRGLAIMMVVGIHTYTLGEDSTVVRQMLNTAVPLFIAISGYFLSQKKMENKDDYCSFLKKQLPKVYLPILLWSLPLYALALYSGSSIIKQTILLLGCGLSIYCFVAFIMQCYVVLPVINNCISVNKSSMGGVIASCLISFVWIAGVVFMNTIQGKGIPLILYAGPLPCWLMFFVLGVVIGHKPERNYSIILPLVITILVRMLSIMESDYLLDHYGKGVGIKPSSFIYSTGMIFLMFSNKMEKFLSQTSFIFIIWIGSLSFSIYLIHYYFISFCVRRLPIDSWLLQWALALFLIVVFILIIRKIFPTKYHKYLDI